MEFIWEGVNYLHIVVKGVKHAVVNPRTMNSCGIWNAKLKIIEFDDAEHEQLHEEEKAKQ